MAKNKKLIMRNRVIMSGDAARSKTDDNEVPGYTETVGELMALLSSGVDYLGPAEADGQFHVDVAELVALLEGLHEELREQKLRSDQSQSGIDGDSDAARLGQTERENLLEQLADSRHQIDALQAALQSIRQKEISNQDTIVGLEERLADSKAALEDAHARSDYLQKTGVRTEASSGQSGSAGAAATGASLLIRYPGRDIVEMPLVGDLRIGRGDQSGIRVVGPTVSRLHAILMWDGQVATIQDCDSTNGVYVNGTRVREQQLQNGDEFRVGSLHCIFRLASAN